MTTREVAAALGLAEKEVRRLAANGTFKRLRGCDKPMKFAGHAIAQWLNGETK
jgi:hypothetical protein